MILGQHLDDIAHGYRDLEETIQWLCKWGGLHVWTGFWQSRLLECPEPQRTRMTEILKRLVPNPEGK